VFVLVDFEVHALYDCFGGRKVRAEDLDEEVKLHFASS
jgi:hypothetical protein